jgi:FtsP/CotA-like multicopper oxidase with cupredoxin domain
MDRRQFLQSSAALAATLAVAPLLPRPVYAAAAPRKLTIATRTLDINGKPASVYSLTSDNRPGLVLGPGEAFRVTSENRLAEPTIIHWHGLTPPLAQDGVANAAMPMQAAGEIRHYDFPIDRPGSYWMHAHTLQHQNLLSAPLIVRSAEEVAADVQEVVVLLHDFSFTPATDLLAKLSGGKQSGGHGMMDMGSMDMGSMDMGAMDMGAMDLNDITYDAYLANDRTLDDPEVVTVDKSSRVRLRIINGAASTAFTLSTGSLPAQLIAVDGQPVTPLQAKAFALTMGQRIDLMVDIPAAGGAFPILALREGATERTGVVLATKGAAIGRLATNGKTTGPVLDLAQEQALASTQPLAARAPDRRYMLHLVGDMAAYRWGLMGSENLAARPGERIEIALMNMSMMAHPMHLHGHRFQVVAINGKALAGAMRDTVLVPPMQTVTIAFDAGTPGDWPFHCHHLYHMVSGMMTYLKVA